MSAYAGAATLLSGNNLQAAAQILAVEAYHAGNLRLYVIEDGDLGGGAPIRRMWFPANSISFQVDANGLAIKRTTSQVLSIVYANATAGTKSGGFFPSGVNGNINTVRPFRQMQAIAITQGARTFLPFGHTGSPRL